MDCWKSKIEMIVRKKMSILKRFGSLSYYRMRNNLKEMKRVSYYRMRNYLKKMKRVSY